MSSNTSGRSGRVCAMRFRGRNARENDGWNGTERNGTPSTVAAFRACERVAYGDVIGRTGDEHSGKRATGLTRGRACPTTSGATVAESAAVAGGGCTRALREDGGRRASFSDGPRPRRASGNASRPYRRFRVYQAREERRLREENARACRPDPFEHRVQIFSGGPEKRS